MIDRIKAFLDRAKDKDKDKDAGLSADDLHVAVAVLLVEAAYMDGNFDDNERATIKRLVAERLKLGESDAEALVAAADETAQASGELWRFARIIKDRMSHQEKIAVLEMLGEVAYADGEVHHYESNLLRRITGLLYVSDRESGEARKRVIARLGLASDGAAT